MARSYLKQIDLINNIDKHMLFWAVDRNNLDFIFELINAHEDDVSLLATRNNRGLTVLHYAVKYSQCSTLRNLLHKAGSQMIDIIDIDGNTLLHTAIETNSLEKVQAVIAHSPDLRIKNSNNLRPTGLLKQSEGKVDNRIVLILKDYSTSFANQNKNNVVIEKDSTKENTSYFRKLVSKI